MRVLVYVLLVVVTTVLCLGAGLLVALEFHRASQGLLLAAAVATPLLVMGPLLYGALVGTWDRRSSETSRRVLRWWFLGLVAADVVAAVIVVVTSLSARAPLWVPVVVVVGSAGLFALAEPVGRAFRRAERPLPDPVDESILATAVVRRKARVVVVTFVSAVLVAAIGATVLALTSRNDHDTVLSAVLLAGQLTFTATAMAAVIVWLPYSRALRDAGGRDLARLRRIGRVVLRGKQDSLDEIDERAAVQYARIVPLALQFQLVYLGLLYLGIAFQFVSSAVRGDLGVLPWVFLALQVVALVVIVPLTLQRIRRAREYADRHGTPVEDPVPIAPPG